MPVKAVLIKHKGEVRSMHVYYDQAGPTAVRTGSKYGDRLCWSITRPAPNLDSLAGKALLAFNAGQQQEEGK